LNIYTLLIKRREEKREERREERRCNIATDVIGRKIWKLNFSENVIKWLSYCPITLGIKLIKFRSYL
jgi:hypothetical protein